MNWDAVAAIAELIGALGVIATLAFLGFQMRQNSRLLENNTRQLEQNRRVAVAQAVSKSMQQAGAMLTIAPNAELSEIMFRGLRDYEALSPLERMRFAAVMGPMIAGVSSQAVEQIELEIQSLPTSPNPVVFALAYLDTPGGRQWWARYKKMYPPVFRDLVNQALRTEPLTDNNVDTKH